MSLRKIGFNGSTATAEDQANIYAALADGRLAGCAVTYAGGAVGIAKGYLIAHGRLIENTAAMSVPVSGTGVAQVVLLIHRGDPDTVSVTVRTAANEAALPAITQADINDGSSTTYEMELALVDLAGGSLLRSMGAAAWPIRVVTAAPEAGAADGIYFVVEE
ncbi:MAG: hypothetical protein IJH47_04300 [Oscillospiraceae bacterium]|nr:hypothetical protein [Oscillospiraceae bacterium]